MRFFTARRFAVPLTRGPLCRLDRFLGIGWTAHENGRSTCGCISFLGILYYPKAVMTRAGNCGFPPSPSRHRSACITLTVCDNPHCRTAGFEKPSVQPKEMCAGAPLERRRLRTRTRTSVARPSPYQTSSPRGAEFLATVSRHACDTMSHRYPDPCHAGRTGGGRARSLRAPRPPPSS